MERLLFAGGPYPQYQDKLRLYGWLVGSWDIDNVLYLAAGERKMHGEWHFAWVLGGRGIQDVLFEVGAPAHMYGTSLRCYDEKIDAWHISWMSPGGGEFATLIGRAHEDGIIQEGSDGKGGVRWTFTDIRPDSFRWQGFESDDDGTTWTLVQEMHARRSGSLAE